MRTTHSHRIKLCDSWSTQVEPPHGGHKSHITFTVASLHIAAPERKPSMANLSPAWNVQPDFVKLDYPTFGNTSINSTPPVIPHIIHQVRRVKRILQCMCSPWYVGKAVSADVRMLLLISGIYRQFMVVQCTLCVTIREVIQVVDTW